ncbi:MAG: hypothetical protein Q7S03_02105 [bacterium]|nr:hypothetical protein [bacterium]
MNPETIRLYRWYLEAIDAYTLAPKVAQETYFFTPDAFLAILKGQFKVETFGEAKQIIRSLLEGNLQKSNLPDQESLQYWQEELQKAQAQKTLIDKQVVKDIERFIEKRKMARKIKESLVATENPQLQNEEVSTNLGREIEQIITPRLEILSARMNPQEYKEVLVLLQPEFEEAFKKLGVTLTTEEFNTLVETTAARTYSQATSLVGSIPQTSQKQEVGTINQAQSQEKLKDDILVLIQQEIGSVGTNTGQVQALAEEIGTSITGAVSAQKPASRQEYTALIESIKPRIEEIMSSRGIPFQSTELESLVSEIGQRTYPTSRAFIPVATAANIAQEEGGVAFSPLYTLLEPTMAVSFVKKIALAPVVKTLQFTDKLAGEELKGNATETWRQILHQGLSSGDVLSSLQALKEKGVSPENPDYKKLERKLIEVRDYEKAHPKITRILKHYHEYTKLIGKREIFLSETKSFLPKLSQVPVWITKRVGKGSYSLQLRNFFNRVGSGLFFEKTTLVSGKTVIRFTLPDKIIKITSLGRFSSFSSFTSLIKQKTIRPITTAIGKSFIGQGARKAATWALTRLGLAAIPTGVTQVIAVGLTILDIVKPLLKKLPSKLKKLPLLVLGIALGLAGTLFAAPLGLLFFGISAISLGSVFFGARKVATTITAGATAGAVGGAGTVGAILLAITAPIVGAISGFFIVLGLVVLAALTFYVVIVTSAAFIGQPAPTVKPGGSQYIIIAKTATIGGVSQSSYPNSVVDEKQNVQYQLTVTATNKNLTNLNITDTTTVTSKTNGSFTVNYDSSGKTIGPWSVAKLDSGQQWTTTYSIKLSGDQFKDSVVNNTVNVTTAEGETSSHSLSFSIGTPPASSCPVIGGRITCASLGDTAYSCQHGSTQYWADLGLSCTAYPIGGCYCNQCAGYGFAIDVAAPAGTPVYLPSIYGKTLNWSYVEGSEYNSSRGWGYGRHYIARDGVDTYYLMFAHLNGGEGRVTNAPSGSQIGTIFDMDGPHTHIELQINSAYKRPEFLCQ